ncbi:MAG: sugE [Oscillospiraceae bacterium]|jgi:quaternary ammonium compound-resistance protein SugE|nr:sugE [Oscillospiraceae bacterium]
MQWLYLGIAGILEVFWAVELKLSQGFTKPLHSVFTIIGMVASFYFLSLSLKNLPLGTAYAVWTGIGTVGTLIVGIILFKETIDAIRIVCISLIIIGILGLKFLSPH